MGRKTTPKAPYLVVSVAVVKTLFPYRAGVTNVFAYRVVVIRRLGVKWWKEEVRVHALA